MKAILETFALILAGVLLGLALPGCITVRQSGAHDITVNTQGNDNKFEAHTDRQGSAQSASAEPKLSAVGDEALKTAGKTLAAVTSGGLTTIPQAAAKIAEKAAPAPTPDASELGPLPSASR